MVVKKRPNIDLIVNKDKFMLELINLILFITLIFNELRVIIKKYFYVEPYLKKHKKRPHMCVAG